MAIQLAKWAGAAVYTTASELNHPYVKQLGADVAIDYTKNDFEQELRKQVPEGFDVVYDCVGGDTLKKSVSLVRENGVLVTICDFDIETLETPQQIKKGFVFVAPNSKQLQQIATLFEEKKLKVPELHIFPLEKVKEAQQKSQSGHVRGKLVLTTS